MFSVYNLAMKPRKALLHAELTQRIPAKELSTLLRVSSSLAASLDLSVVLQTSIQSAVDVLDLDTGAIYQLDGSLLFLGATTPPLLPELEWLRLQPQLLNDHPHLQESLRLMYPVYIVDAKRSELSPAEIAIRDARDLRSILFIPLLLEEKGIGAMILGSTSQVRDFTDEEIDLCRILAYQVTLAVANARLFKSVQETNVKMARAYEATLLGWSLALEMRDQETQGHTKRVTRLAEKLARRMGVSDEDLAHIRRGSLLHDIGKMSIPDTILKKDGPLNDAEWVIMRKHPEYAYQFLVHIDYLLPALDIPYCHHEKWDGSGYPRRLKGEEIPLSARIFALVDVFDALTSDRPYRQAWSVSEAVAYIREQAGKHFDPCAATTFLQLLEEND